MVSVICRLRRQRKVFLLDVTVILADKVDGESPWVYVILRFEDLTLVAHDDLAALQSCPHGLEMPIEEDETRLIWWCQMLA